MYCFYLYNLYAQSNNKDLFNAVLDKWSDDLNNYLIYHSDDDLAMAGLYKKFIESRHNKNKELDLIDFKLQFLDVLNYGNLGTQSLLLAEGICASDILIDACDNDEVFAKLVQSDPKNLAVYLRTFNDAKHDDDVKKVKSLLKSMSNTTRSFMYFANSQKLDNAIDAYIKLNPFDENIDVNDLFLINDIKFFSKDMIIKMKENPEIFLNVMTKIGYKLMHFTSSYTFLTRLCQSEKELSNYCLSISNTLIEHSDTLIDILIGYSIKSSAYQLMNKPLLAAALKIEEKNFYSEQKCINEANYAGKYSMENIFDLDMYNLQAKIEREKGEYQATKLMAEINYQRLLEKGDEHAIDPNTCYH